MGDYCRSRSDSENRQNRMQSERSDQRSHNRCGSDNRDSSTALRALENNRDQEQQEQTEDEAGDDAMEGGFVLLPWLVVGAAFLLLAGGVYAGRRF